VESRQRCGRTAATGGIEQQLRHDPSSGSRNEVPTFAPLPSDRGDEDRELVRRYRSVGKGRACVTQGRHAERPPGMDGDSGVLT
jgi:hypothetical protein